ncbi:MAG: regulatory protein RecX [Methylococcaceae bacterium]|nr:regulatory protein RecX [Methylococcaceae bacterium]MDP2394366.1 regulatory protein RecX [Methylococcaceae bacterium]MDP3021409.1 regulatory protein RecX [Methylococcaceae bacterium]MDP3388617.1 regulatory protein RecX [Methylococcaceae bacterium]MDP3931961.1 regulatory protein RecX [Methylococcaceae bacterium]
MLTQREHSQKELLDKLALRGFTKEDVLPVVEDLADKGWQSDIRYAESYARSRIMKGYGPARVAYELKQNGVEINTLDQIVQTVADSWMSLIEQVYDKKYQQEKLLSRGEWAKRSRFLLQRGFSFEMINALFDQLQIKFL